MTALPFLLIAAPLALIVLMPLVGDKPDDVLRSIDKGKSA